MPSLLPYWPGLEEMAARTRPVWNWSRRGFSTSLVFCLSAYFLPVFLLILRFSTASSASVSLALCVLPPGLLAHLTVQHGLLGVGQLGSLLSGERLSIVGLIPLTEGGSVNDNNGILDESLGPDKLIVAGIVDNVDDPGLAGSRLRGPCKVSSVEPEGPVLLV